MAAAETTKCGGLLRRHPTAGATLMANSALGLSSRDCKMAREPAAGTAQVQGTLPSAAGMRRDGRKSSTSGARAVASDRANGRGEGRVVEYVEGGDTMVADGGGAEHDDKGADSGDLSSSDGGGDRGAKGGDEDANGGDTSNSSNTSSANGGDASSARGGDDAESNTARLSIVHLSTVHLQAAKPSAKPSATPLLAEHGVQRPCHARRHSAIGARQ